MAGLHPPEFKVKVESKLDMKGHWKDKPDEVFDFVREVAIEWRTVELADKQRHQTRAGRATSLPRRVHSPSAYPLLLATSGMTLADLHECSYCTCFEM